MTACHHIVDACRINSTGCVQRALAVVRELLSAFPEIAGDLLGLLQMVDDGQAAVIGGLENRRVRAKLKELFPLLGLSKVRSAGSVGGCVQAH